MLGVLRKSKTVLRGIFLFGMIFALCGSFLGTGFGSSNTASAYAQAPTLKHLIPADCKHGTAPTSQSLLVVLLDRSGSLVDEPGATDPEGYSTSVVKAIADLWPGAMIVIPFGD